jgi:hypothetical protein
MPKAPKGPIEVFAGFGLVALTRKGRFLPRFACVEKGRRRIATGIAPCFDNRSVGATPLRGGGGGEPAGGDEETRPVDRLVLGQTWGKLRLVQVVSSA